jgi:hypothetical protein
MQLQFILRQYLNLVTYFQILKEQDHKLSIYEIYIYSKKYEYFINEKFQSSYIECTSQKIKQPIQAKHHV